MRLSVSLFLIASAALSANATDGKQVVLQYKPAFEQNIGQLPDEVLYLVREFAIDPIAVAALYVRQGGFTIAPDQVRIDFAGGAPEARLIGSAPQPGVVNTFEGSDPEQWVIGAKRFGAVTVSDIYPGISLSYRVDEDGFRLIWSVAPHADLSALRWKVTNASSSIDTLDRLALSVHFGIPVFMNPPVATQTGLGGTRKLQAHWVSTANDVEVTVEGRDPARWMNLEMAMSRPTRTVPTLIDAASGDFYGADSVNDLVWRDGPISFQGEVGGGLCEWSQRPSLCRSVRVVRFDAQGQLRYVSYFGGDRDDHVGSIMSDGAGAVWVSGSTESLNFPLTGGAFQPFLKGPESSLRGGRGDMFLLKLDGPTGRPLYSTYLGREGFTETPPDLAIGESGDAFLHGYGVDGLKTTAGALSSQGCFGCAFVSGWEKTGQLRYLTYFPAAVTASRPLGNGSLLVGGSTGDALGGVPGVKTVGVPAGNDAYVAKIGPQGKSIEYALLFATGDDDEVKDLAVDSAGRIWIYVESRRVGFRPSAHRLLQLAPNGSTILKQIDLATALSSLTVDGDDNLFGFRGEGDASFNCGLRTMIRVDAAGTVSDFEPRGRTTIVAGFDADQRPILRTNNATFETVDLAEQRRDWIACAKNGTTYVFQNSVAPGEIVTIFGRGLGPDSGMSFTPENGRVPLETGGTRVSFNGTAAPVLYAQSAQVNTIAPFSLTPGQNVTIQIDSNGKTNEVVGTVVENHPQLFVAEFIDSLGLRAAAINEDGTVNAAATPARPGEAVSLFLSGAGESSPALVEGEIAAGRGSPPLQRLDVFYEDDVRGTGRHTGLLEAEYLGTAPGLVTSVLQLNVRLPGLGQLGPLGAAVRVSLSLQHEGKDIGEPAFIYVCTLNCKR